MKHDWIEVFQPPIPALGWDERTKIFKRSGMVVLVSDGEVYDNSGEEWRHVSFSRKSRLPDWNDMKTVREKFFPPEATVIQVFPPESQYRNLHEFCLHFWWNKSRQLLPIAAMGQAVAF